jgi:hypothetical protein
MRGELTLQDPDIAALIRATAECFVLIYVNDTLSCFTRRTAGGPAAAHGTQQRPGLSILVIKNRHIISLAIKAK